MCGPSKGRRPLSHVRIWSPTRALTPGLTCPCCPQTSRQMPTSSSLQDLCAISWDTRLKRSTRGRASTFSIPMKSPLPAPSTVEVCLNQRRPSTHLPGGWSALTPVTPGVFLDKAAVLHYARIRHRDGYWVSCECCFTVVHNVLVACTSVYLRTERSESRSCSTWLSPLFHSVSHY